MNLQNERELINTKRKLQMLETTLESVRIGPTEDEHLREVEIESLTRLVNQLREEISRYEAHCTARA